MELGIGTAMEMGKGVGMSVGKFFLYAMPFIIVLALLLILFLYLRKMKVYGIDCIIDTLCDGNLVRAKDKGGVVINTLGVEEFRFKRLKKGCPIPPRKFWILQNNGKFGIHFFRHSDEDFEPVDIRQQYKNVTFTPIKSDSKQYLVMKGKEIVMKHKLKSGLEKWGTVAVFGGCIVLCIFMIIWYFKYAGELADKQLSCITAETCKQIASQFGQSAVEGLKSPF